jgi:hypothetical protein
LGIGIILLMDMLSGTLKHPKEIEHDFQLKMIALIPHMASRKELLFGRINTALTAAACLMLAVMVGLFAAMAFWGVDNTIQWARTLT